MNRLTHLRQLTPPFVIALALLAVRTAPNAFAVVPPPDGGYPNFTTAEGDHALQALTLGLGNTAIGTFSMFSVTTGNFNTAVGAGALDLNTADSNTATGAAALLFNTTGTENTATGTAALEFNGSGNNNTANGAFALFNVTTASNNTAVGVNALSLNATADGNTAVGSGTLRNTTAGENTAIGSAALINDTTGSGNTASGHDALNGNTTGSHNTALGENAGAVLTTGDNNIDIGYNVLGGAGDSNTIKIGNSDITTTLIRGINGTAIMGPTSTVLINSNDQLGTLVSSSKRFKQDIKPMDKASEALFALKPVTFRYKKEIDPKGRSQFGLVAEDVEAVNPDLIVRDKEGEPSGVYYDAVNAMLLNEFLKEHKAFVEAQHKVEKLETTVATLAVTVKEQAAQIQKVSAQREINHHVPQVAEIN